MEKPLNARFSSGPCAKHRNWIAPSGKFVGRSHRSSEGIKFIQEIIRLQKKVLAIPEDYFLGIVNASTTGGIEALMWSLLGEKPVDALAQCVFSNHWANDIVNELKIPHVNLIKADFPERADVSRVNFNKDVVFCLSSTTSGVSFEDLNWIPSNRQGLIICDAASAVFAMDFDWTKLDAVAFSWQKGIGGEAGLGSIVLSPRAVSRLESYKPDRPIPKIFRIAENKKINFSLFNGYMINTPSMICLEDFSDNLIWADRLGGIKSLAQRVEQNYNVVKGWISRQNVFRFLVDEKYRAHHIVCLDVVQDVYQSMSDENKWKFLTKIVKICEKENVGFDFLGHIQTKPHLRIWTGPTIDHKDLEKFLPWLEFAYNKTAAECF
ncbi:MAG: phosphoserine transaminase [Holosporaceae bacterium]|jgi:phosphoserine aminotransferase|nr:phosphoserine transaminase [Holosporaceae bacterium]